MNIYAHFHAVPPGLHRAQVVSAAEAFHYHLTAAERAGWEQIGGARHCGAGR